MNWRGMIASILAGSLGSAFLLAVFGIIYRDRQLGQHGAEVLAVIGGGMISIVSYYMGKESK